jgi:hypothetical protein
MVKVTLKTTLTSSQNKHPPGIRNSETCLSSPGVLPVSPTPLLVLAPDERRGEDQNFSKQTTHLFLLRSREPEKDRGVTTPALVGSVETIATDPLPIGQVECSPQRSAGRIYKPTL